MTSCCSLAPLRGEGEYPTYIACNLFTEVETTYVPWSGWMDDRFPKITQTCGDGDKNLGYIANMRNTATAGFKYFDCQGIKRGECAVFHLQRLWSSAVCRLQFDEISNDSGCGEKDC